MSNHTEELTLSRDSAGETPHEAPRDEAAPIGQFRLSPEALLERRRTAQTVYIFDLRDAEAYESAHLPGAFNLPFQHMEDNLHRMPFQGDLLLYDGGEGLAQQAAAILHDNAFTDFYFMEEGYGKLMETLESSPKEIRYAALSTEERAEAIERVLDERVREYLASDGGGLEVIDIGDDHITVAYQGACDSCSSSTTGTLRFIQMALTSALNHDIEVVPVEA